MAATADTPLDRSGTQWAPFIEWALDNPTYEGNPYDLPATATFVHAGSGETRTTGMYYDGHDTWRFRFTGTRTGTWTFSTSSPDPDLDGRQGKLSVGPNPNPNATGFVTGRGNKWARPTGEHGALRAFVPQLLMYTAPKLFHGHPEKVDADIQTFLVEHGFNGFHVTGDCHWFDIDTQASNEIDSDDPNPDPRTFEALDMLITKVHAAGGMVHLWAWGDDARHWTPCRWGKNGKVDQRLQRYIAARLGPLPGWTMGYGFDNFEWVNEEDLRGWHDYLHRHFGWPHLLGARGPTNDFAQIYDGLDYWSYEQHRPDYRKYVETIELRPDKPSFSEDRFRIRQNDHYAFKDYDMEMTRRGLWHSTMAGGVANIWGCLEGQPAELGSRIYPNPEWIKTWSLFFERRFVADMTRDETVSDGVCLKRPTKAHYVFYKEDTDSIALDLREMDGSQHAVAVDTMKAYKEIELGPLAPEKQTWNAPCRSDWAIAIGKFE